ncbi:hypothetical protein ACRZB4_003968 [Morganella morganii]|nr:hypothetical protein [Morganella morganii]EKU5691973.1 hypothetical protein [Morganella morganii]
MHCARAAISGVVESCCHSVIPYRHTSVDTVSSLRCMRPVISSSVTPS